MWAQSETGGHVLYGTSRCHLWIVHELGGCSCGTRQSCGQSVDSCGCGFVETATVDRRHEAPAVAWPRSRALV